MQFSWDGDTNNISNKHEHEHLPIKVKAEVKTEDDVSTDDECNSEKKEPERRRKSPRLSANHNTQPRANIDRTTKKKRRYCSKRKREVDDESNIFVKKACHITALSP